MKKQIILILSVCTLLLWSCTPNVPKIGYPTIEKLVIYPNPFIDILAITLTLEKAGNIKVMIPTQGVNGTTFCNNSSKNPIYDQDLQVGRHDISFECVPQDALHEVEVYFNDSLVVSESVMQIKL